MASSSCPTRQFHCGRAEARPSTWGAQWEGRVSARPCGWQTSGMPQKNSPRPGDSFHVPPAGANASRTEKFSFFGDYSGRGGWPRERGEIFGAWRVREHSPPSERGGPPEGRWLMDCEFGAEEKGGGGSTAEGRRCMRPLAPSLNSRFVRCGCGVALAATADRSTPPVAASAACLLPCMDIPFMAAPPPSRRGESPVALLVPCIRGIPEVVPL